MSLANPTTPVSPHVSDVLMTDHVPSNSSTSPWSSQFMKVTDDPHISKNAHDAVSLHRLSTGTGHEISVTEGAVSNSLDEKLPAPLAVAAKTDNSAFRAPCAEVHQRSDIRTTCSSHERDRAGSSPVSHPRRILSARGYRDRFDSPKSCYQSLSVQDIGKGLSRALRNMGDVDYRGDYGRDRGSHGGRKRRYRGGF